MDELTCRRLFQMNKDAAVQQQTDRDKILGAMLGSFLSQKYPPHLDSTPISPTTVHALQALARLRMSPSNSHATDISNNHMRFSDTRNNESKILNKTAQEIKLIEPMLTSRQNMICVPLDLSRPFCQCQYRRVWLPRDIKSYQVKERSERYFNCLSMTYELRKYYEHQFSAFGLIIFQLNIFIDDKGHLYGIVEQSNPQSSGQELKFNLIIKNTDSNEFISHEGLALPVTEKSFHFAFRVEKSLFDSYFIDRKLIRGKSFTCSLIVERSYVNSSKKYFK